MFSHFANALESKVRAAATEFIQSPTPSSQPNPIPTSLQRDVDHSFDPTGTRRSLFIGIHYTGSNAPLRGCHNDVLNLHAFLTQKCGFPTDPDHCRILVDDPDWLQRLGPSQGAPPTRENILSGMKWLVQDAKPGDSLFLHYSGHGGSIADTNGDEIDGMDETICPVDYASAGQIIDDELFLILVKPLPPKCRLTALFDSCHSGTVMDLPFTYKVNGALEVVEVDNRKAIVEKLLNAGVSYARGQRAVALGFAKDAAHLAFQVLSKNGTDSTPSPPAPEDVTQALITQFSGCRDEQTSADAQINGNFTGAMSHAFIEVMQESAGQLSYLELLRQLREFLQKGRFQQIPQMSTGARSNMDTKFVL